MMADTEELLTGEAKSECDKLYRFIFPIGTVIIGGAGDSHFIDCANQELHQFFSTGAGQTPNEKMTPASLLLALNTFAAKFYRETTGAYRGFAYESIPRIEMLIAVNCNQQTMLFRWMHNRVVWISPPLHASVGSGVSHIHPMLRDIQFSASKECMLFYGMKMMFHAKRTVIGVGGATEAIALQDDGRAHYFGTSVLRKIEELAVNYEEFKTKVLDGMFSTIAVTDPKIEPELEANIQSRLAKLGEDLKTYRQAYKDILKPQLVAQKSMENK
jgi:hypothetical protein